MAKRLPATVCARAHGGGGRGGCDDGATRSTRVPPRLSLLREFDCRPPRAWCSLPAGTVCAAHPHPCGALQGRHLVPHWTGGCGYDGGGRAACAAPLARVRQRTVHTLSPLVSARRFPGLLLGMRCRARSGSGNGRRRRRPLRNERGGDGGTLGEGARGGGRSCPVTLPLPCDLLPLMRDCRRCRCSAFRLLYAPLRVSRQASGHHARTRTYTCVRLCACACASLAGRLCRGRRVLLLAGQRAHAVTQARISVRVRCTACVPHRPWHPPLPAGMLRAPSLSSSLPCAARPARAMHARRLP